MQNNKPAFEAKLTKQEGDAYPGMIPIVWNRVWAKDKTLVFGFAAKNKIFDAIYLATSDPNFVFSGGIRVGASTKVLENFFSDTIHNIGTVKGNTIIVNGPHWEGPDDNSIVQITCKNGVITEIVFNWSYSTNFVAGSADGFIFSQKALDFANKQAQQMGLSGLR